MTQYYRDYGMEPPSTGVRDPRKKVMTFSDLDRPFGFQLRAFDGSEEPVPL